MPTAAANLTARSKRRGRIYGLRTFMDPGCPVYFAGAFRDNVRRFLRECADVEDRPTAGMPTWCTLLADEKSGVVVPLFTVEESVQSSPAPFCDYCRSNGWSHHFVSKRRYHLIIPADADWDKPLRREAFRLSTHHLHGLLHCNGFGHLLLVAAQQKDNPSLPGRLLMDLWDRLCSSLRVREVTVEDLSQKNSMDLRLLLGVAYGYTWFARWGYTFRPGSFGLTKEAYDKAIDHLSSFLLDSLVADLAARNDSAAARDLRRVVATYRSLRLSDPLAPSPTLSTVRDLLRYLLDLLKRTPPSPPTTPKVLPTPPPAALEKKKNKRKRGCRDFAAVAAELASRWSAKRLKTAAGVIVDALLECGGMTRQEVRDAARLTIGDTGLLDFVLKSLGNCIVGRHVVRRKPNPSTRVLEFSLEEVGSPNATNAEPEPEPEPKPEPKRKPESEAELVKLNRGQVETDVVSAYKSVVVGRPEASRAVLDGKHWGKEWGVGDDESDDWLRFLIRWLPASEEEMGLLTRGLPPAEVVLADPTWTVKDFLAEAERALRDTYCVMDRFTAAGVVAGMEGAEWEPVMVGGAESGGEVWMGGEVGPEFYSEAGLKYEGGAEGWRVGCEGCGARDDDGERMVACDVCDVWHHTRCVGIGDGEAVPKLFLCAGCGSNLLAAAAGAGDHPSGTVVDGVAC